MRSTRNDLNRCIDLATSINVFHPAEISSTAAFTLSSLSIGVNLRPPDLELPLDRIDALVSILARTKSVIESRLLRMVSSMLFTASVMHSMLRICEDLGLFGEYLST